MGNYQVYFSNPAKAPIVIDDGTIDTNSTSLVLVGRNYPGFGAAFATDLVHLLENSASPTPPSNPIEGQLWFDTSDSTNKKLKINDGGINGTIWSPVNGVFQQPEMPTNAKLGDIWVDTANQQLNFYNGLSFTLVGPNYSSVTKTGSYSTTILDSVAQTHNVIINYINDVPIEVISSDPRFIPNPVLLGFTFIDPGINISSSNVGTLASPVYPQISGTANSSYNLTSLSTGNLIPTDSFLRNNINQTLNGTLSITIDADALTNPGPALQLGANPTFILSRIGQYTADFSNTFNNGRFTFQIANNAGVKKYIMILDGSNQLVTINDPANITPTAGMNINGLLNVATSATANTLYALSSLSSITAITGNALQVAGGAAIGNTLLVQGRSIVKNSITVGPLSISTPTNTTTSMVVPSQDLTYDIGDPTVRWRKVYASVFQAGPGSVAQFTGIATSATYLATPSAFSIAGDFTSTVTNFQGAGTPVTLYITATTALITNRTTTATSTGSDLLLVYTNAGSGIHKQKKNSFLSDINYYDSANTTSGVTTVAGSLVPIGTMIAYAGVGGVDSPAGWLLCDGSAVPAASKYDNLRTLLSTTYDPVHVSVLLPKITNALASTGSIYINYIIKY